MTTPTLPLSCWRQDLADNRMALSAAQLAQALSPLTDLAALHLQGNTRLIAGGGGAGGGSGGATTTVPGSSSGSSSYIGELFLVLPSLEVCDRQERAQVLVVAEGPPVVGGRGVVASGLGSAEEAAPPESEGTHCQGKRSDTLDSEQ